MAEENQRPKVAAVDDQSDSLRLLQMRLRAAGMEDVGFSSGQDLLAYPDLEAIDVIVLDVMMPEMDGFEVCRRLKANPISQDIPVIFLTANMDESAKIMGLDAGAHDYLNKPVRQEELIARTRAAFRVKDLQDRLRARVEDGRKLSILHQSMLTQHWEQTFGQLAASLAHEINNPLAAALGNCEVLSLELESGTESAERLEDVVTNLKRTASKLRSLLSVAYGTEVCERVNLSELLTDLVTVINYRVTLSTVALKLSIENVCYWNGVVTGLARTLLYLLNNALDAVVDSPEPKVEIRLSSADENVLIKVRNNGPAIDAECRERIFDAFFTTKGGKHHGVGLHLTREYLETIDGMVEFESPCEDGWTEFTITVPRALTSL